MSNECYKYECMHTHAWTPSQTEVKNRQSFRRLKGEEEQEQEP